MARAIKKRTNGRSSKRVGSQPRNKARPEKALRKQSSSRSDTKQSRAIAMLRSTTGASIAALMEATGWQQHSVRGFLAGVVRKRLGLKLESSKVDGSRVYRIASPTSIESDSTAAAS